MKSPIASVSCTSRALFARLCSVMAIAVAGSELAQAVTISISGTTYDVITTSDLVSGTGGFPYPAITYQTLSSGTYPLNDYSYTFENQDVAAAFAAAYNASSAPAVLKTANDGILGEIPSNPGESNAGGPLFFTHLITNIVFPPNNGQKIANGMYFTNAAVPFGASAGGTGVFASAPGQLEVWALYKQVAVPEPSTYAMALAGLACGGYSMFRRRRDKATPLL